MTAKKKSGRGVQFLSGRERREYGCIMTFENAGGERLTLQRSGIPAVEAVRALLDQALARDETFRVISYSTPEMILGDLSGQRSDMISGAQANVKGVRGTYGQSKTLPEVAILSRVGRQEMLHPRLLERRSAALLRQ